MNTEERFRFNKIQDELGRTRQRVAELEALLREAAEEWCYGTEFQRRIDAALGTEK